MPREMARCPSCGEDFRPAGPPADGQAVRCPRCAVPAVLPAEPEAVLPAEAVRPPPGEVDTRSQRESPARAGEGRGDEGGIPAVRPGQFLLRPARRRLHWGWLLAGVVLTGAAACAAVLGVVLGLVLAPSGKDPAATPQAGARPVDAAPGPPRPLRPPPPPPRRMPPLATKGELIEANRDTIAALYAQGCHVQQIANAGEPPWLSVHFPAGSPGEAVLRQLRRLKGPVGLNLFSQPIEDLELSHLAGQPKLRSLRLSSTRVTDRGLAVLESQGELVGLDLSDTAVTDAGLAHLAGLSRLTLLDLTGTRIHDAGLRHLRGLTRLKHLTIARTKVGDRGLRHLKGLTRLTYLQLAGTTVGDTGLVHLKGLSQLEWVGLIDTRVTESGVSDLQLALPKVQVQYE